MGELVKVFKPDASVIWVCRGMIAFGGVVALAGVAGHQAMISCLGIFLLTIFLVISFRQSSQTIQVFTDRVVFLYPGQEAWAISFNSFRKLVDDNLQERFQICSWALHSPALRGI